MSYKQDLPPKEGFPYVEVDRFLPKRGPTGFTLLVGVGLMISFGIYKTKFILKKKKLIFF